MPSLSPLPFGAPLDFEIAAGTTDTIHVTDTYTVAEGDTLELGSSPGFKLEVKHDASVSLDIEGTAVLQGGLERDKLVGIATTLAENGAGDIHIGESGLLSVTLRGPGQAFGVIVAAEAVVLDNEGEIQVTGADGDFTLGVVLQAKGAVFTNEGQLHVHSTGRMTFGAIGSLNPGVADISMTNTGLIEVSGGEQVYGFSTQSTGGTLDNQGHIAVQGFYAAGMLASGAVTVTNSGTVEAVGVGEGGGGVGVQLSTFGGMTNTGDIRASGPGGGLGVWFLGDGVVDNSGSIIASGSDSSVGIYMAANNPLEVVNSGLIKGASAIVSQDAIEPASSTVSEDTIINSGKLVGDVLLGGDDDSVSNTGRINGDVDFGDGDDVFDSSRGHMSGSVIGGLGGDQLTGSLDADTIYGDRTDDSAGGGDDVLRGMKGDDSLFGGQGADTLTGGAGADNLSGGDGADVFRFTKLSDSTAASSDLITNLTGSDQIDLHLLDADTGTGGDQAFHLVGAFGGHAGELTVAYDSGADLTTVSGDVDGDGVADLVITIAGDSSGFSNFVL